MTLPVAVILKRLATDFFVFIPFGRRIEFPVKMNAEYRSHPSRAQVERPTFFHTLAKLWLLVCLFFAPELWAQSPIYFLLGPSPVLAGAERIKQSEGSAVIPLTKASDIAHARKLIEAPGTTGFAHPVVRVQTGKIGINRNYYEAGWPEYSWYPYQVVAFADVIGGNTATTPKLLESSVNWSSPGAWDETKTVGFADLTVVQELGPSPVLLRVQRGADGWELDWVALQPMEVVFTLEMAAQLEPNAWQSVPGSWPAPVTHWTMKASDLPSQAVFFRVRLDLPNG
jgi:hypothetical protein